MLSLTYLSSATVAVDQPTLEKILETSRLNNERLGLTGMLLYADEHFVQTLEGEDDVVDAAYERISQDTRHRNIIVALREPIAERSFPDWSMGFAVLTGDQAAELPGFSDFLDPDSDLYANYKALGRAGVFHRAFRDQLRLGGV